MLNYQQLKSERQWKATIGLSESSFLFLSQQFGKTYEAKLGISLDEKATNLKISLLLPTYSDCLFMVLFSTTGLKPLALRRRL